MTILKARTTGLGVRECLGLLDQYRTERLCNQFKRRQFSVMCRIVRNDKLVAPSSPTMGGDQLPMEIGLGCGRKYFLRPLAR